MKCCFATCNNDNNANEVGVTFHSFPTDYISCQAWLNVIGLINTDIKDGLVCSDHFKSGDFCIRNGVRELRHDAVPFSDRDEIRTVLKVCRICLVRNVKMYAIKRYGFYRMYQELTGINLKENTNHPQYICWECAARLNSSVTFQQKALRTEEIIKMLLDHGKKMTLDEVKCLNRHECNLQTTLIQTHLDLDDIIVHEDNDFFSDPKSELKDEIFLVNHTESNHRIENVDEEQESFNQEHNIEQDTKYIEFDSDSQDIKTDDTDQEQSVEDSWGTQDAKYANSDDAFDPNMSDPDHEVTEPEQGLEEDENLEVNSPKAVKRSSETRRTALKKSGRAGGPCNKAIFLDKKLFTIKPLSYNEQKAEVEKRKESFKYILAPYKCTVCYSGFMLKNRYDRHMVRHSAVKGNFQCFICKTRLRNKKSLKNHLTALHSYLYKCNSCPFVTKSKSIATQHKDYHSGVLHQCPYCPAQFKIKSTYNNHIREKHVSEFVCELCGYTFVSEKGVHAHKMRTHKLTKDTVSVCHIDTHCTLNVVKLKGPYCDVCESKFSTEEAFARHLKLSSKHATDSDRSKRKKSLPRNIKDKEGLTLDKPVACEQCGVMLSSRRKYSGHFRSKHPNKNRTVFFSALEPCMCEVCGQKFHHTSMLRDHISVHTNEVEYECDDCGKMFPTRNSIVSHLKTHRKIKTSFLCSYCGKCFSESSNRSRHIKMVHYGLKENKCAFCDKRFLTPSLMRTHARHVHFQEPWPKRRCNRKPLKTNDDQ